MRPGRDSSLVMQFFGSKNELFAAAMSISPEVLARFSAAFEGPEEHLGQRVVRASSRFWEGAAPEAEPFLAMLRGAISNEHANAQLRQFIQARLFDGIEKLSVDYDGTALHAGSASSMLVGVLLGRRMVGVPALADASVETLIALMSTAIHRVLTGELPLDDHTGAKGDADKPSAEADVPKRVADRPAQ